MWSHRNSPNDRFSAQCAFPILGPSCKAVTHRHRQKEAGSPSGRTRFVPSFRAAHCSFPLQALQPLGQGGQQGVHVLRGGEPGKAHPQRRGDPFSRQPHGGEHMAGGGFSAGRPRGHIHHTRTKMISGRKNRGVPRFFRSPEAQNGMISSPTDRI